MPARFTGGKEAGINLELCHDTAQHILGQECEGVTAGGTYAEYRYVRFVDAIAYVAGHSVCLASATTWDVTNDRAGGAALANLFPVGVVFQTVVPTQNQYGWVQCCGIATIIAGSAAIIAGDTLKVDASSDGLTDEGVNGTDENIVGVALATIADNAAGLCMLAIRGC